MKIAFYKYHGTGNDFILIDNRSTLIKPDNTKLIAHLCDRHLGIGADGLIFIFHSSDYNFKMSYFNSDGNESSMCGNGGRCIVAFAKALGLFKNNTTNFWAIDDEHSAEILSTNGNDTLVKLSMHDVLDTHHHEGDYIINSGSPHYIRFVDNADNINIITEARNIRYNDKYKHEGININFVQIINNTSELRPQNSDLRTHDIYIRTYERGVEDETLSCGTGVVASALAYALKTNADIDHVNVKTRGGDLKVYFKKLHDKFKDIWLEGPATFVFKGELDI
jgi:diaminopimelate epimerase